MKKSNLLLIGAVTFCLLVFFYFGFQHLSNFITADEHYWAEERIPQYWQAILDKKFKKNSNKR